MAEISVYHGTNPDVGAIESNPGTVVLGTITYHGLYPDIGAVESTPSAAVNNVEYVGFIKI